MLNGIWLNMIIVSIICAVINGRVDELVVAVTDYAKIAFELALSLAGVLVFWLGLMRIAKEAGLIQKLAHVLQPLMTRLFPEVPVEHPAMGSMIMNIAANMLGMGCRHALWFESYGGVGEAQSSARYGKQCYVYVSCH